MRSFGAAFVLVAVACASNDFVSEMPYPEDWAIIPNKPVLDLNLKFTLAIKEQNLDRVLDIARAVSDPSSATYGQFVTQAQLDELTAPAAQDVAAVTEWLDAQAVNYTVRHSNVFVNTNVLAAEKLFSTNFHIAMRKESNQFVVRAGAYSLPATVNKALTAVFGLHGLPLPPRQRKSPLEGTVEPASVTPAVLATDYGIKGVDVTRSTKNRQAVAEFQGQFMNATDLATFFKSYVPAAKAGDEKVFKFVGAQKDGEGVEALLDIQYIMGVAPGIKTEFWEYQNMDFCLDLFTWTSALVSTEDIPIVHSVSYGWQGNLTQVQCKMANADAVDVNFGKLAAKGVSIMISSGDSGSAFVAPHCDADSGVAGITITKGVLDSLQNQQKLECCDIAQEKAAQGYTWVPPPKGEADSDTNYMSRKQQKEQEQRHAAAMKEEARVKGPITLSGTGDLHFTDASFYVSYSNAEPKLFPKRSFYTINGNCDSKGGVLKIHNANGTFADTTIDVGPEWRRTPTYVQRNATMTIVAGGKTSVHYGKFPIQEFPGQGGLVSEIIWYNTTSFGYKSQEVVWNAGVNPPPPPPRGNCSVYTTVESTGPAPNPGTFSGGPFVEPKKIGVLWPSWPASSPWVTAVGATRFVGQKVGAEEMATDQFGSGGGFSAMFSQSPNAKWQSKAVQEYLKTAPGLPPAAMYPADGRATPDVSALGEGYQVVVHGRVEPVGGTSASSPAFAGMVSLLNEARFAAGKKQLGFLNPFLYANADAFTDITKGSDKISRQGGKLAYGFNCSKGWDPATGLGTPLFQKLLAAALAAP